MCRYENSGLNSIWTTFGENLQRKQCGLHGENPFGQKFSWSNLGKSKTEWLISLDLTRSIMSVQSINEFLKKRVEKKSYLYSCKIILIRKTEFYCCIKIATWQRCIILCYKKQIPLEGIYICVIKIYEKGGFVCEQVDVHTFDIWHLHNIHGSQNELQFIHVGPKVYSGKPSCLSNSRL